MAFAPVLTQAFPTSGEWVPPSIVRIWESRSTGHIRPNGRGQRPFSTFVVQGDIWARHLKERERERERERDRKKERRKEGRVVWLNGVDAVGAYCNYVFLDIFELLSCQGCFWKDHVLWTPAPARSPGLLIHWVVGTRAFSQGCIPRLLSSQVVVPSLSCFSFSFFALVLCNASSCHSYTVLSVRLIVN